VVRRRATMTSHEVGCSTKCFKRQSCKRIGLLAPTMTSLFPESLCGVTPPPAPDLLRDRVHPSMNFTSPTEYEPLQTCPTRCRAKRLPWGFVPHRDISPKNPLASELPKSRPMVRPQRFSRSRRLAPLRTLRVCFTPQPRPGFTFQGFSPAAKPNRLVGDPCPLAVRPPAPAAELPRRLRIGQPHLQGFVPGSDSKPPTG